MHSDGAAAFAAYLEHLSDDDLRAVAVAHSPSEPPSSPTQIRSHPELLAAGLADPRTFAAVFGPPGEPGLSRDDAPLVRLSPFLVFAVAVERAHADVQQSGFVPEWLGPRRRVPVFGPTDLRDFLADPWRRLFLVRLLGSYTHVTSGSVFVPTRRGYRRQRFSELDPVRLAGLLEVVPAGERPGIYRRLGDLALFLTGVFPDHTATSGFGPVAEARLLRAGRLPATKWPDASNSPMALGESGAVGLLEELGRRWYRLCANAVPPPRSRDLDVVAELSIRFSEGRRILNLVTDRYLFPLRDRWFGPATG
jgi:hypothetical protein